MTLANSEIVYSHADLKLIPTSNPDLIARTWTNNKQEWGKTLDIGIYHEREKVLASQEFTAKGKLQVWILVPKTFTGESSSDLDQILSAVESFERPGLIATKEGGIKEGVSVSIASVFTPAHYRGHGYASLMMKLLWKEIEKKDNVVFTFLYSDVGPTFYGRLGWAPMRSDQMVIPTTHAVQKGAATTVTLESVSDASLAKITQLDAQLLRETLKTRVESSADSTTALVAVTPEPKCIFWLHARSRFVAQHIHTLDEAGSRYQITDLGAKDTASDSFVLWFHDLLEDQLYIIRWRVDPKAKDTTAVSAALVRAAQDEARKAKLAKVVIWNPDQSLSDVLGLPIEHRESAIPSLGLTPSSPGVPVEWVMNEKYSWC
ncbi:hypothetical protein EMPS_09402 [Entomortierella parvispora]|uniref:LYC1 C-terminal domain-containing protein n=1 Tax=Entomortierella parvispora TaxID=205924 RepID=A0A9P3HII1_9FUNG|nr:hypothetical protein EMPS_09402 [Entomortierella parvispora]